MIEQLKELFCMQAALDAEIMRQRGVKEYPTNKARIALFVELGELMNELQTNFKYWKADPKDNREKALYEYVDCLHFAISLTIHSVNSLDPMSLYTQESIDYNGSKIHRISEHYDIYDLLRLTVDTLYFYLRGVFALGVKLGFTWEEIYQAYISKNKVNYERLKNNY